MQTKIGDKMYITKFFYGKAKNPNSKGRWRNRKAECAVFEVITPSIEKKVGFFAKLFGKKDIRIPAVLKEICRASTQNCHGESFEKAIGRRYAFLKAIEHSDLKEYRRAFVESFDEQCASSATKEVTLYVKKLMESVRQA